MERPRFAAEPSLSGMIYILFRFVTQLLRAAGIHVVGGISDHTLDHLAADGAGLTRGDVAVVSLLETDAEGAGDLALEALELLFVLPVAGLVLIRAAVAAVAVGHVCTSFRFRDAVFMVHGCDEVYEWQIDESMDM